MHHAIANAVLIRQRMRDTSHSRVASRLQCTRSQVVRVSRHVDALAAVLAALDLEVRSRS